MRWKPTRQLFWVTVVSMGGLGAVACGDDDEASSVERYCELVQELDEAGSEAFADLEQDESATEGDFAEAERQFVEDHQDDFDELREVAPDEIADDIDVLLAAQEERAAGGDQEEVSDEVVAAEERVGAFEEANCGQSE
jgi:hypothetical protein